MTVVCGLSILAARNRFYPRPLRQSGNQGTARIVQPVHRRKLRSIFNFGQYSQVCPPSTSGGAEQAAHLQLQAAPCGLSFPAGVCLPLTASRMRRWPLAVVLSCSFSINRRLVLLTSKEVLSHSKTARMGTLECAGKVPYREYPRCLGPGIVRSFGGCAPGPYRAP